MTKPFEDVRVMETLLVPKKWDKDNYHANDDLKRLVIKDGVVNLFERHCVTTDQVREYVILFWATTTHGADTSKYHMVLATTPKDNDTLNIARDKTKLKRIILEKRVWNSLTYKFQKKIITDSNKLEMSNEYDGVVLWGYLRRTIMLSTKVGALNIKSDIEASTLKSFDNNVLK